MANCEIFPSPTRKMWDVTIPIPHPHQRWGVHCFQCRSQWYWHLYVCTISLEPIGGLSHNVHWYVIGTGLRTDKVLMTFTHFKGTWGPILACLCEAKESLYSVIPKMKIWETWFDISLGQAKLRDDIVSTFSVTVFNYMYISLTSGWIFINCCCCDVNQTSVQLYIIWTRFDDLDLVYKVIWEHRL